MNCSKALVLLAAFGLVGGLALAPDALAGTNANGWFDSYLVLGPYTNVGAANPGAANQAADFLCDADTSEEDIEPFEGLELGLPDVGGCAKADSGYTAGSPALPTVVLQAVVDLGGGDGTLDINAMYSPNDNLMAYAWVYVENSTASTKVYTMALGSDDGVAVSVNRALVWNNSIPRGTGANQVQDRFPVTLLPGGNLIQFKVFEGGSDWRLRARLEDENCQIVQSGADVTIGTEPVDLAELQASASRSISIVSGVLNDIVADVTIAVNSTATYAIQETFDPRWSASNASPAGATIGAGSIGWTNIPAATTTVSYRLTSSTGYGFGRNKRAVKGTITTPGQGNPIAGASLIPFPAVREVLVTPPLSTSPGGCGLNAAQLSGNWIGDGDTTDASIIPEEGDLILPAFGTDESQATGWTAIDPANFGTFFDGDPLLPGTSGIIAKATSADGFFNWNDVFYGADPNICMNVAYFYVENTTAQNPLIVYMGVGTDDAVNVRVNGRSVWTNPACRGYTAFQDKFGIGLDPGKNLIAIYTFEEGGGFNMGVRFETREGGPIGLATTVDPTGYDPDPAKHPDHSAAIAPRTPSAITELGFVTQYLVPQYPLNQVDGANGTPGALAEDYIGFGGEAGSVDTVFEGALFEPSPTGRISTSIRQTPQCFVGQLVRLQSTNAADPGLFNGETFYGGAPDNYTSSVFFFLTNKTTANQDVFIGWGSDDASTIYLDGAFVGEFTAPRGYGPANSVQAPGPVQVTLTPGTHLVQGSYVEGGGGSGIRVGVFEAVGPCVDSTVDDRYVVIDPEKIEVSATNPTYAPTVTARRTLGPLSCENTAKVTITFSVPGGGSTAAALIEELPLNAVGSNPTRGQFDAAGSLLTFSGQVSDGDTLVYDIEARLNDAYCPASINGVQVSGDSRFSTQTDVCTNIATGLYLNCGGSAFAEPGVGGRRWLGDTLAAPSKHLTSPNQYTALGEGTWVADLTLDPFIGEKGYTARPFQTERWSDSYIEYTFTNLPANCYEVVLLFNEHCCSDGCDATVEDPINSPGGCRVFDVTVNGVFPTNDDPNVHPSAADGDNFARKLAYGNINGTPTHLKAYLNVTDGRIVVRVDDLGAGSPPENASIMGIAITVAEDPSLCEAQPPKDIFRRGDADADGVVNITDAIFVLNYLFQGGQEPTCLDAADADNEFSINITDGIYILGFLFLGGLEPPAPGPFDCGPEPADDPTEPQPLDCQSYGAGC